MRLKFNHWHAVRQVFVFATALEAKGRMRRGDFSMVRIRLKRFALPRLGLGGSKSGVFCSPLVCRVLGDHRKRQSERSPARSVSLNSVTKWSDLFVTKYSELESHLPPCHDHSLQTVSRGESAEGSVPIGTLA